MVDRDGKREKKGNARERESSQDEPALEKQKAAEKGQENSNFVSEEECERWKKAERKRRK